jgi:C4-dicarboxylate transporter DctM subunit
MAPMLGFLALPIALLLCSLHLPVALILFGLGVVGLLSMHVTMDGPAGVGLAGSDILSSLQSLIRPELLLIPLIVTMGNLAFYGGLSTRIYDAASRRLRHLPGGMAVAAILGCGGFSALCGSSTACATSMGRICVPEMVKQGYDARLATASVAMGGTLGALIPPSLLFVVYALFSGSDVADLFLAGLLPGLLSLMGMCIAVLWWIRAEPVLAAPSRHEPEHRDQPFPSIWPALLPGLVVLAGLLTDAASPVTVVALAVVVTVAVTVRHLAPARTVIREIILQSLQILLLVAAARVFFDFVTTSAATDLLIGWTDRVGLSNLVLLMLTVLVFLVLGMFLEPAPVLGVTLPFLLPLVAHAGMDLIWFGIILIKLLEMGLVTPPVGMNVFIVSSVTRDVRVGDIFSGVARFLMVDILVLLILILFPVLSTLLPSLI